MRLARQTHLRRIDVDLDKAHVVVLDRPKVPFDALRALAVVSFEPLDKPTAALAVETIGTAIPRGLRASGRRGPRPSFPPCSCTSMKLATTSAAGAMLDFEGRTVLTAMPHGRRGPRSRSRPCCTSFRVEIRPAGKSPPLCLKRPKHCFDPCFSMV